MSAWLALLAQIVSPASPDAPASVRSLPVRLPVTLSPCESGGEDDIVVCGGRRDRFRLPLPIEDANPADRRVRGEAAAPLAAITPGGACGLFAGQRACSKAEAARYGYGGGRDPKTVLTKLGRKILDPDGELGEPVKVP